MSDLSVNSRSPLAAVIEIEDLNGLPCGSIPAAVIRILHLNLPIPLAAMIGSHFAPNWAMARDSSHRTLANTRFRRREI